jgi:hypothetical protein
MSVAQIRDGLSTTLSTIPDFKSVHKYEPKMYKAMPAASVFFEGFEQNDNSRATNELKYRFIVRIAIRLDKAEEDQAVLDALIDKVITTLAKTRDLGKPGICYNAMVVSADTGVVVANQQIPQLVGELIIDVNTLVPRT